MTRAWGCTCNTTRNTEELLQKLRYFSFLPQLFCWPARRRDGNARRITEFFFGISCVLRGVLHVVLHVHRLMSGVVASFRAVDARNEV